jgi:hypothetical protein
MAVATDKAKISLYVEDWVKERSAALAKKDRRSLSSWIEVLMIDAIKAAEGAEPEWTFQDRLPPASSNDLN